MKHQKDITGNRIKYLKIWTRSVLTFFLASIFVAQITHAQNEAETRFEPLKINGKEVKEYLMEKYKLQKDDVSSDIQQTQYGPSGKVHLRGEIITKATIVGKDKLERSRAIAKAFFQEEFSLLGITNINEIREIGINSDKGHDGEYTMINYRRFIDNLEMGEMYIRVEVGPGDKITWVDAKLVPVSSELYLAVKKKSLTEAEIRNIIEDDLKAEIQRIIGDPKYGNIDPKGIQTRIFNPQKIAISSYPYIIWVLGGGVEKKMEKTFGVDTGIELGSWHYRVNAFTGKILSKREARIIN